MKWLIRKITGLLFVLIGFALWPSIKGLAEITEQMPFCCGEEI